MTTPCGTLFADRPPLLVVCGQSRYATSPPRVATRLVDWFRYATRPLTNSLIAAAKCLLVPNGTIHRPLAQTPGSEARLIKRDEHRSPLVSSLSVHVVPSPPLLGLALGRRDQAALVHLGRADRRRVGAKLLLRGRAGGRRAAGHGHVVAPVGAEIHLAGTGNLVLGVVEALEPVRQPADGARNAEQDREHVCAAAL